MVRSQFITAVVTLGCILSALLNAAESSEGSSAALTAIQRFGGSALRVGDGWDVAFHLRGRSLTNEDLAQIVQLGDIVSLNLRDTQITGAGLVHLRGLTRLRRLHLERTKVSDEGFEHLAGLSNLEYLNLYSTEITDKSLEHLAGLMKLKRLYVWQTGVTDEGVARLERMLPKLKVSRGVDLTKLAASFPPQEKKQRPTAKLEWVAVSRREEAPARSLNGINTRVYFENQSGQRVKLYWITYGGELKLYAELDPEAKREQNSYARNAWLITDHTDNALGYFVVATDEALAIIPKTSKRP